MIDKQSQQVMVKNMTEGRACVGQWPPGLAAVQFKTKVVAHQCYSEPYNDGAMPLFAPQADAVSSTNDKSLHVLVGEIISMIFRVWHFSPWPATHRKRPDLKCRGPKGVSQRGHRRLPNSEHQRHPHV